MVPLKRAIAHMRRRTITDAQIEAQRHFVGIGQVQLLNQLLSLFEHDLIDWDNERVVTQLKELRRILNALPVLVDGKDEDAA